MRTTTATALLLGFILAGAAPSAEAHRSDVREEAREVRALAARLERATDELLHEARRAAGRVQRHELRALHAFRQLELAADEFRREVRRSGALGRDARHDLARVQRAFRVAIQRVDALDLDRQLRRDLRSVDRLLDELDESLDGGHRPIARRGGWPRLARH